MNPEEVAALLREAQAALARGESEASIDAVLRERFGNQARSVEHLFLQAKRHGLTREMIEQPPPKNVQEAGILQKAKEIVAPIAQGTLGSQASNVLKGLEKIGVAAPGAAERFSGDLEAGREKHPVLSIGGQVLGSFGGPSGAALKLGGRAVGAAARGAGALAARSVPTVAAPTVRTVGGLFGGAAAGAAEGAVAGSVLGSGEAATAGQDQLEGARKGAIAGGLFGIAGGGLTGLLGQGARGLRSARHRGEEVAGELAERGKIHGAGDVIARQEDQARRTRSLFENLSSDVPESVTDITRKNTTIRKALRRSGSEEADEALENFRKFEAGELDDIPDLSFDLADDIRKDLKFTADAFKKRLPDASGKVPSATKAREARAALKKLEAQMEQIAGFGDALESSFLAGSARRAYKEGRKLKNAPVEEIESALGKTGAKQAFREGLAVDLITNLRKGEKHVDAFMSDVLTGTEMQKRMRVMLGGDEAFEGFLKEVRNIEGTRRGVEVLKTIIKWGSFFTIGSSVLGQIPGLVGG